MKTFITLGAIDLALFALGLQYLFAIELVNIWKRKFGAYDRGNWDESALVVLPTYLKMLNGDLFANILGQEQMTKLDVVILKHISKWVTVKLKIEKSTFPMHERWKWVKEEGKEKSIAKEVKEMKKLKTKMIVSELGRREQPTVWRSSSQ